MIACYTGTRQDNRKENYSRLPFRGLSRVGGQVSDFIVIKKISTKTLPKVCIRQKTLNPTNNNRHLIRRTNQHVVSSASCLCCNIHLI